MPFGAQSTCSDAESSGGSRQGRFRLNAANTTPSACFHSLSTKLARSRWSQEKKGSRGTSVFQHCVWAFSCPGFCEVLAGDFACATSYVPFQDQAAHWQLWEVFTFMALAMRQRPVRVSLTANRSTQPGRLRSRQHAATSTVMRATNPDRYPPQNMCMISVKNWRTPTQKERRKTQTARVAWMCGRVRDKNSTCINHVVLCCGGIDVGRC